MDKRLQGSTPRLAWFLWLLPLVSMLLASCGGGDTSPTNAPVQITYSYLVSSVSKDATLVQDALNKILKPKLNITVKLQPYDWASFEQKVKLNFTSGQPCDVVWTASWINNFYQNVANGNLLPLDDLLPKYAPKLYASMSPQIWNAAKVKGKTYAVINQQIFATAAGFTVRKDLADKYKLDVNTIKSYADLEPFLKQVKEHEPGVTPVMNDTAHVSTLGIPQPFDTFGGLPVGIRLADSGLKVLPVYDTPEYKQMVELAYRWHQLGYMKDPDDKAFDHFDVGQYAVIVGQTIKPGGEIEFKNAHKYDNYQHAVSAPVTTTGGITATLNGICRSSQHPAEAMKFLEELNSNPELYNTLSKGIEGKHWVWADKAKKVVGPPPGVAADKIAYSTLGDWMFGNQFNGYYTNVGQVGAWEATKKLNDESVKSPALGFSLDTSPIKTQAATLATVAKQYLQPLEQGIVNPATGLPQAIQALKNAGIDTVITETQSQLTAWKQTT